MYAISLRAHAATNTTHTATLLQDKGDNLIEGAGGKPCTSHTWTSVYSTGKCGGFRFLKVTAFRGYPHRHKSEIDSICHD